MFKRAQPARLLAVSPPVTDSTRLLILRRKEVVFGGAGDALNIADTSVGQSHAVIARRRGRYVVSDLKSTSGTFVNDQRVRRRRTLKHRDSIRFATGIVYRFIDPDASLRRRHRRITLG